MNVIELARLLGREDGLEKVEETLSGIRRLAGVAPRPVNVLEVLKAQRGLLVFKTEVRGFDEKTLWGGLRCGLPYGLPGKCCCHTACHEGRAEGRRILHVETGALNRSRATSASLWKGRV